MNRIPDRGAFRNLCDLTRAEAERILRGIAASGKRSIRYLPNHAHSHIAPDRRPPV